LQQQLNNTGTTAAVVAIEDVTRAAANAAVVTATTAAAVTVKTEARIAVGTTAGIATSA